MAEAVRDSAAVVEQMNERIEELERRVLALEGQPERRKTAEAVAVRDATPAPRAETWQGFPSPTMPSVVPVLGKAVLGMAGAYLLRALAESSPMLKIPVLILAIAYAGLWMVGAVRNHQHRFASFTFATTSVMILSPLLWESTVRFRFLPAAFTGVILFGFFVVVLGQSWSRELQVVPWVATLATVITALALIVATHEVVPLSAALLAVALATEVSACLGHHQSLRAVPALAADVAVLVTLYVMSTAGGAPEGYPAVAQISLLALWIALLTMYVGSIGVRAFCRGQPITVVDIGQGALALTVAVFGAVRSGISGVVPALGGLLLLYAAGCYWGALSRFADEKDKRNRRICATWAVMLLIAGSTLSFPANVQTLLLCGAAVAAAVAYAGTERLSLALHASLYLVAAAMPSGLLTYAAGAMIGAVPKSTGAGVWIVAASAALCYALASRSKSARSEHRALLLSAAAVVGCAVASISVVAVAGIVAGSGDLAASRLSVIRTVLNCALAVTFAFLGMRWKRVELGWLAYAAVGFGTLKLFLEDLRYGNAASLVVSLLFYGLILIVLPRVTRRGGKVIELEHD